MTEFRSASPSPSSSPLDLVSAASIQTVKALPNYPRLCLEFLANSQPCDEVMAERMELARRRGIPAQSEAGQALGKLVVLHMTLETKLTGLALKEGAWMAATALAPFDALKARARGHVATLTETRADLRAKLLIEFFGKAETARLLPQGLRTEHAHGYMQQRQRQNLAGLIARTL